MITLFDEGYSLEECLNMLASLHNVSKNLILDQVKVQLKERQHLKSLIR